MSCRLVARDAYPKFIGDMWFVPERLLPPWDAELSAEYKRDWRGKRDPLMVILPDRTHFCVDQRTSPARAAGTQEGWRVTGEPPALTLEPSIHIMTTGPAGGEVTSWHGFLRNGELTSV